MFVRDAATWIDPAVRSAVLRRADGAGLAHETGWRVGQRDAEALVRTALPAPALSSGLNSLLDAAFAGRALAERDVVRLFEARGPAFGAVCAAADALRCEVCGDVVTYVVTRNINYTNVCGYRCRFCAFSKGSTAARPAGTALRSRPGRDRPPRPRSL